MTQAGRLATIVGWRGFIGQALTDQLRTAGWTCHLPERDATWPNRERFLGHIFYCAGLTADFAQRPADTIEAHVSLVSRVLQSNHYESLVYLSSTRLYDGLQPGAEAKEETRISLSSREPRHLYDLSKLTGEAACLALGRDRARIARLASVYSLASSEGGFLPSLLSQVADTPRGRAIQLSSSPWFARDYIHVADVVSALIAIAVSGVSDIYNVAAGENTRNDALAQLIESNSGRQVQFVGTQAPLPPPRIDISRMRDEFGWKPQTVQARLAPWLAALG